MVSQVSEGVTDAGRDGSNPEKKVTVQWTRVEKSPGPHPRLHSPRVWVSQTRRSWSRFP